VVKFQDFSVDLAGNWSAGEELDTSEFALGRLQSLQGLLKRHRRAEQYDFVHKFPGQNSASMSFRMTAENFTAAVVTLFAGRIPVMISAAVSGADADADDYVLQSLENFLSVLPSDEALPPQFDLARISQRPAVVSVALPVPRELRMGVDLTLLHEWNRHCAAALFSICRKDLADPAIRDAS
jgi:hypothetical protein